MIEVIVKEKDQEIQVGDLVRFKGVTHNTDLDGLDVYYVTEIFGDAEERMNALVMTSQNPNEKLLHKTYDLPIIAFEKFYGEVIFRQ